MLFITGTTLSVPSLMGAIMAVGVASANSILLVTFAHEQQLAGKSAFEAAIDAGHTRIRPVLMTAAAMIVGMIPMAIGGAGEEQNAALARAVIGGLLFATPTTLLVVPYLFAMLRKGNDGKTAHGVFEEHRMNDMTITRAEPAVERRAMRRRTRRKPRRWAAAARPRAFCSACAGLAFGAWRYYAQHARGHGRPRSSARIRAERAHRHGQGRATAPCPFPARHHLGLPTADIFARASGYVDKRYVDIGDQVSRAQLLAEITAPELDHQIAQAQATLSQMQATLRQSRPMPILPGHLGPRQAAGRSRAG